jgi:hypothetical protein
MELVQPPLQMLSWASPSPIWSSVSEVRKEGWLRLPCCFHCYVGCDLLGKEAIQGAS